ncbi:MAG: mechanosensitive ion channel family protein [Polyangia bacterium]|jgi:small-conductance mechanosensitive channel|nr:mechanosensitive ion channel family protein [Polyangia bacterium]
MLWGIDFEELWALPLVKAVAITLGAALGGLIFNQVISRVLSLVTSKTRTDMDDRILKALHRPMFWTITLIGAAWAITVLGPNKTAYYYIVGVIKTVAVVLWTTALFRVGTIFLTWLSSKAGSHAIVQPRTIPLFDMGVKVVVTAAAIYTFMLSWNINVTGWLASAGILGLAIGFAAKDTIANLFAGVFILADAPYKLGDYVDFASGERGKVVEIGMRSTRIVTRDDIEIVVPNSAIANGMIVNESGGPSIARRIKIKVGVAYGSDVDQVKSVLLAVAEADPGVLKEPAPRVRFRSFGDSGLDFELLGWIEHPEMRGRVTDSLNTAVYKAFGREGIQIPFPQRDVHIISAPAAARVTAPVKNGESAPGGASKEGAKG